MIEFKVKTTFYRVESEEKRALIEVYCAGIKKRTGKTSHKRDCRSLDAKQFPAYMNGASVREYVRAYYRLNFKHFWSESSNEWKTITDDFFAPLPDRAAPIYDAKIPLCVECEDEKN